MNSSVDWTQVLCLHRQSSLLKPGYAFPESLKKYIPDTVGQNWTRWREGYVTWYGNEHPSKPSSNVTLFLKWFSFQPPTWSHTPPTKGLLPAESWNITAGIASRKHTPVMLPCHANADIPNQSPSSHCLPLCALLHLICLIGSLDMQTSTLLGNLHICCNQISSWLRLFYHSPLSSNITSWERILTPPI